MKNKWGTPDVVGVYRPSAGDIIKFTPEIVSAEIKVATSGEAYIAAFGQSVAYRLFSTKSYMVIPDNIGAEKLSRLETLAMLYGIGLVLFQEEAPRNPQFHIRVRAQRLLPDMFYVNEFADRLKQSHPDKFKRLFG